MSQTEDELRAGDADYLYIAIPSFFDNIHNKILHACHTHCYLFNYSADPRAVQYTPSQLERERLRLFRRFNRHGRIVTGGVAPQQKQVRVSSI